MRVTLNRPEARNAPTGPVTERCATPLRSPTVMPSVSIVAIRGTAQAFCAGADLISLNARSLAWQATVAVTGQRPPRRSLAAPQDADAAELSEAEIPVLVAVEERRRRDRPGRCAYAATPWT